MHAGEERSGLLLSSRERLRSRRVPGSTLVSLQRRRYQEESGNPKFIALCQRDACFALAGLVRLAQAVVERADVGLLLDEALLALARGYLGQELGHRLKVRIGIG